MARLSRGRGPRCGVGCGVDHARPIRGRHRRHRGSACFDERPCRRRGRAGRAHSGGRSASHLGRVWGSEAGIVDPQRRAANQASGGHRHWGGLRFHRRPHASRAAMDVEPRARVALWLAQEPRRLARRYLIDDTKFLGILFRTMRDPVEGRVAILAPHPRRPTLFSGPSSRRRTSYTKSSSW